MYTSCEALGEILIDLASYVVLHVSYLHSPHLECLIRIYRVDMCYACIVSCFYT